jgi:ribulose-phosphate 3-epimerase
MQIIPAILESEIEAVADKVAQLQAVKSALPVERVQIDVLDGNLVPNLSVTATDLVALNFNGLKLDFHLMTEDPLDYVWELASQHPALPVCGVFGQVERMSDQSAFLHAGREQGWETGLALDLATPLDSVADNVWPDLASILLLAVPMGSQGQNFNPAVLTKITDLQSLAAAKNLPELKIYVDGGIKAAEFAQLKKLGVTGAVVGSFLWQETVADQWRQLV